MYGTDVYEYAEDVLSHHGIHGMKWGVRKGPPYPLDPNPAKQAKRKAASISGKKNQNAEKMKATGLIKKDAEKVQVRDGASVIPMDRLAAGDSEYIRNTKGFQKAVKEALDVLNGGEYKAIDEELNRKIDELIKSADRRDATWDEYAKYKAMSLYPHDKGKQTAIYDRLMKSGSYGDVSAAWDWMVRVKEPALGDKLKRGTDIQLGVVKNLAEYATSAVGDKRDVPLKTHSNKTITAMDVVVGTVGSALLEEGYEDVYWLLYDYARHPEELKHSSDIVLSHHGIHGMKWGVRKGPPYPLDPNPSKQAKRKAASKSKKSALSTAIRGNMPDKKKKAAAVEKAKATRAKNAEEKKSKEEALKSGSAKEILKHKGKLTNKEMQDALERLRLEKQLEAYSEKELSKGEKIFQKIVKKAENVSSYMNTASNVIESAQRFRKALGLEPPKIEKKTSTQELAKKMLDQLDADTGGKGEIPKFDFSTTDGMREGIDWLETRSRMESLWRRGDVSNNNGNKNKNKNKNHGPNPNQNKDQNNGKEKEKKQKSSVTETMAKMLLEKLDEDAKYDGTKSSSKNAKELQKMLEELEKKK